MTDWTCNATLDKWGVLQRSEHVDFHQYQPPQGIHGASRLWDKLLGSEQTHTHHVWTGYGSRRVASQFKVSPRQFKKAMKTFDHTSSLDFLLVLPADIPSAPYVEYYTRIMQNEKRTWKIITWHRNNDHSNLYQNNELPFPLVCNNSISKVRKFFLYTKFSTFISRKIRIFRPRVILFFTLELPIITLLTYRIDRHTYFLDIRDRSDVLNSFFPFLRDWVINKSKACFISSKSFCKWLPPQKNYCYSPNISSFFLREHKKTARDRINYPRKVLFMGQEYGTETNNCDVYWGCKSN